MLNDIYTVLKTEFGINSMEKEKIYELSKDINVEGLMYIRAGKRGTEQYWKSIFPNIINIQYNHKDWFIDVEEHEKRMAEIAQKKTKEEDIVAAVFNEKGLLSISYKEAAVHCLKLYKKMLQSPQEYQDK